MFESGTNAAQPLPTIESDSASCADDAPRWTRVCRLAEIGRDPGVCALVGGHQVAVVRVRDDRVYAIGNRDPFTGANVLARASSAIDVES